MSDTVRRRSTQNNKGSCKFTKSVPAEPQIKKELTISSEVDRFIRFAQTWMPYGGAPDEDIFVNFGMTRDRFFQKLWYCMTEVRIDREVAKELAEPYRLFRPQFR